MSRTISYDDAVTLLGGDRSKIVKVIDTLLGVGMLALVGPFRDVLGWFDAKAELSRVTADLVTRLTEQRSGLSRVERTRRLEAAHAVIAVTAFFEAMAEAGSPLPHGDLELTAEEQTSLSRSSSPPHDGGRFRGSAHPHALLDGASAPVPGAAQAHEDFRKELADHYESLAGAVSAFVQGLAAFERLDETARAQVLAAIAAVPGPAIARYQSLLGRLAVDFPEVAFWAGLREHAATHERLRDVTTGLEALRETLDAIAGGRAPDERRHGLAVAYRAAMRQPIAPSGEIPAGLRVPTLAEAFLPQLYRASAVTATSALSNEDWWERRPVRDDLLAFLTRHLTSPEAVAGPLLVLGQPGSGKSVVTRILAAQLPPSDFLPVLVVLRAVPAAADLQDQIEHAIRDTIGDRVEWPALSRSAGDALPLIILDGFDELLQATGANQTDYLQKVARLQRREADQGRPVAVIVTSRTSVADRAQAPDGTVALRLEPFDESRVAAWLGVWNRANAARFTGEVAPISLDTVMRYPELASQPLLLLMLALYDAEGNALRSAGALRPDQLYERLLARFARREVEKIAHGLPPREVARRVEAELRRLSVVAFAMLNRGAQWVTQDQLESDMQALPGLSGAGPASTGADGLRAPLQTSELALGSFFFVHRARATLGRARLESYEFLHATFGEYLAARLIHSIVGELVARERVTTFHTGNAVDDDLLHALLSFAPLGWRRQVVIFLRDMASALDDAARAEWADLLTQVYRTAQLPRSPRAFAGYTPQFLTVPGSIAAYTANLLLLILSVAPVTASRLTGGDAARGRETPIRAWRQDSRLWRSQPSSSGFSGLVDLVALDRVMDEHGVRDVVMRLTDIPVAAPPTVDLHWVFQEHPPRIDSMSHLRREAHFTCHDDDDLQQHLNDPLFEAGLHEESGNVSRLEDGFTTPPGMILRLLFSDGLTPAQRAAVYRRWIVVSRSSRARRLLLDQLATDRDADPETVLYVLNKIDPDLAGAAFLRCVSAHLGRGARFDRDLRNHLYRAVSGDVDTWDRDGLDAILRLHEAGPPGHAIDDDAAELLVSRFAGTSRALAARIRSMAAPRNAQTRG
ncbi:NACHT domain-containing protein [Catenuloplanes japonicus]|uniref:NACHT domain-containing protein n=1 Tax=Catenuloplanes japonicus TaxID=33876 RepID=UPI00068F2994|nr:ATP-binding protein [Catenuloplanes japonicus]